MSLIKIGDKVLVYGKEAIATSEDYTKMVYDSFDLDLGYWGYEGGTAAGYINVRYDNGTEASVPLKSVTKL